MAQQMMIQITSHMHNFKTISELLEFRKRKDEQTFYRKQHSLTLTSQSL